jgi:replicative DNA helicase
MKRHDNEIRDFLASAPHVNNAVLCDLANREESRLMSLLLRDKDLMTDAVETGITYVCFQNPEMRRMFRMAAEHFDKYSGSLLSRAALESMLADAGTPEEAAKFKSIYDLTIAEFGLTSDDYPLLKNEVEARHMQRQAYHVCVKFMDELMGATRNQKDLVTRFQNYVNDIHAAGNDTAFYKVESIREILDRVMDEAEDRRVNPDDPKYRGIRSGFRRMDLDYNGFGRQRYMVILATEGGGKTTFMLNLARNFALGGATVVYVTIEATNMDVGRRVLTIQSKIDYNRIMRGGTDPEHGLSPYIMDELRHAKDGMSEIAGGKLHLVQALENTHRETICRLVQRVRAHTKVDVVFIDYLQVVGREVNYGERVDQAIADVSGKFRAWGRKSDVLLVTAQQIKGDKGRKLQEKMADDDEDLMIVKGDTSSTKEIAGSADYMFGVWVPRTKDRMVVWSTKNRPGKDGQKYVFNYDANSGRIEEMGEFGDPEEAAGTLTSASAREDLKKRYPDSRSDIMGDEPPSEVDDVVMGGDA